MSEPTDLLDLTVPVHVVGIGASAGGLEALESFFDNVPAQPGVAFVIVQHLSPDFRSLMGELLARHTDMPIRQAEDGMTVEADTVYLIPPKKEMIIASGRLRLFERPRTKDLVLPIDVFFRSLAEDCGPRATAIVLSGTGSDGSRGVREVFDAGGLVIVQDAESAQFDGMPKSAADVGVARWILPPAEMPTALLQHVLDGASPPLAGSDAPNDELDPVYEILRREFGVDFRRYKPSTITRRIERRVQLARVDDVQGYIRYLVHERAELEALYRDLLIGVTRFFRNDEAFRVLERTVLPELMRSGPKDAPLRVWVAGCSTGEEVYSLAILLAEASAAHGDRPVKIFATDVHAGAIEVAARGLYGVEALAGVSAERRERWFEQRVDGYQAVPELREMIVFTTHDVIHDAPFTRIDLVSCRNLLIYLQPEAQQKCLAAFHFALRRDGVLFLGPSESTAPFGAHLFETVDRHWRIFRKSSDEPLRVGSVARAPRGGWKAPVATGVPSFGRYSVTGLLAAYDVLLDELMPPSLLVNERGDLVHAFAGASRFLKPHDGRQGAGLLESVDGELRTVLVGGLQRMRKGAAPTVFKGVRIEPMGEGESELFNVTVRRVESRQSDVHILISFEAQASRIGQRASADAPVEVPVSMGDATTAQVGALEEQLAYTKENLHAAVEELETANEELQATNEELLASNEELQGTNEELQSVNEELYTVNSEYQRKIEELTLLSNDMNNLLASTEVGTIFLDPELRIRKFTPQIAENFALLPQDLGRSIEGFTHKLEHPELLDDIRRVLASGSPIERELRDGKGRAFFLRILPYRAKGLVAGVVVTLIDVTGLKAAEDALFHERYLLNSLMQSVPDAIYFKDADGRFIRANEAFAARLGLADPHDVEGKTARELRGSELAGELHEQDERVLRAGAAEPYHTEKREGADGVRWDLVTRHPLLRAGNGAVGILTVMRDVSEQKRIEARNEEAVRLRDEFLSMLSHELRNPLGAIVIATSLLKQREESHEPHVAKLVGVLDRQGQQMSRLLDDLLEVSRVTQNKIELRKRTVDLATIVKEAAEVVRATMEEHGHDFRVEIEPGASWVEGDPARLQQIQVNLLGNAAKYTPRGGRVTLRLVRDEGHAAIHVIDTGVGMSKQTLENAFELFVQSPKTLDRADGGLGVGLTLVRSLVTMHGGTVTASSGGEGKGCEFVVRLPLTAAPSSEAARRPSASAPPGPGLRAVLVEDNPDSRELLSELLRTRGFECRLADRGDTGLSLVRELAPDLALVDIGLPVMDGFEVARQVRRDPALANVVLVALTGYGRATDRDSAASAGFDAHIVKPLTQDDLARLVDLVDAARAARRSPESLG